MSYHEKDYGTASADDFSEVEINICTLKKEIDIIEQIAQGNSILEENQPKFTEQKFTETTVDLPKHKRSTSLQRGDEITNEQNLTPIIDRETSPRGLTNTPKFKSQQRIEMLATLDDPDGEKIPSHREGWLEVDQPIKEEKIDWKQASPKSPKNTLCGAHHVCDGETHPAPKTHVPRRTYTQVLDSEEENKHLQGKDPNVPSATQKPSNDSNISDQSLGQDSPFKILPSNRELQSQIDL